MYDMRNGFNFIYFFYVALKLPAHNLKVSYFPSDLSCCIYSIIDLHVNGSFSDDCVLFHSNFRGFVTCFNTQCVLPLLFALLFQGLPHCSYLFSQMNFIINLFSGRKKI